MIEIFGNWVDLLPDGYERPEMTEVVMLPVGRLPPLPRIRP
jgi:hypothetical protein